MRVNWNYAQRTPKLSIAKIRMVLNTMSTTVLTFWDLHLDQDAVAVLQVGSS
jgi:hypothetical protein